MVVCLYISKSIRCQPIDIKYATLSGSVFGTKNETLPGVTVLLVNTALQTVSDANGKYKLEQVPYGTYEISFFVFGKKTKFQSVLIFKPEVNLNAVLEDLEKDLSEITVEAEREKAFGLTRMSAVENFGIYEGKKTEVIELSEVAANLATNNARQVYSKVTGLNIWESDGAGLQLGIGGRGLSPNRTANFNVRQNGYDISADALGYPESYYTPPLEALDRIELVRGAAALQYGTQFGGMLNFRFKKGPKDKKISLTTRQTYGSWNFFNSFNSLGGTLAKGKLNYYAFVQFKRGDGFRPNSRFNALTGFASLNYTITNKWQLGFEYTGMNYLAQQPGGLTDKNFEENVKQSFRERNWFEVKWKMLAVNTTYEFNDNTQLNSRFFGLIASRNALGNLERINVADLGGNRMLISGSFNNIGNESRLLHKYKIGDKHHTFLIGSRLYLGNTSTLQGDASDGKDADFRFLNPSNLENSDYRFLNKNVSAFCENIFHLTQKWSITPGLRFEHILTSSEGYYKQRVFDNAGNLVAETKNQEQFGRTRNFVFGGMGTNFRINNNYNLYANFTQNYRAINFSDIKIVNPNFKVDNNIKDESGYSADAGFRGNYEGLFTFELTAFFIRYNNKIGQVLRADLPPLYLDYRFRGNISDARNIGAEFYGELNLPALWNRNLVHFQWTVFTNLAFVDARYINTDDTSIKNKKVEMVPPFMFKCGTQVRYKSFRSSLLFGRIAGHFSDATNAIRTSAAVEGIIPAYQVMDLSLAYSIKKFTIEGNINNLLNATYFTRRAESYPGPGIIPSEPINFHLTLGYTF